MDLFKLFGSIAVDNTKAKEALEETKDKAKDTADETEEAFNKIGNVAKTIVSGFTIVAGAVGGAFIGAVEGTREYRAQMGLLDAAFETAGHNSKEAKQTYSELNAVLGDSEQAVEASQHLAKIADNEKELSGLTDILTGAYATFGESLPLEGLAEGILHSSSLGTMQGSLADALEWSGITVEDFNEKLAKCADEEERQDLIVNTLKDTYGKASDQYKDTNKDIMESRKAHERLSDVMADIGKIGEPILTGIKNAIADMAEKAVPKIEALVDKFVDMSEWVKDNEDTIDKWVAVIIGATASIGTFLLILNWGTIMTAAANAIKTVRTAILAMNAAMLANPIALVVAVIVGLVAAFIYLWNNVDGFREFWINAWKIIRVKASEAWTKVKETFSGIGSWFRGKFNDVQQSGKDALDKLKKRFSDAWKSIKNVFSGWGTFFSGLWTKIKNKFSSIGSSIGSSMGSAVKTGLNKVLSTVESTINKGVGVINSAIKLANKLPGIDVGTVKKISLPRLAKGGVLEKGQVGFLEGTGAEAVVPLEHNEAWLSRVAVDLNRMQMERQVPVDNEAILVRMNRMIELLEQLTGVGIYLDTGTLVGELAPAMDAKLGKLYLRTNRGNTR